MAALAGLLLLQISFSSAAAVPLLGAAPDPQLQVELRFRQDFGLNTNASAVATLMADRANYLGEYGVALTPAEVADLRGRLVAEERALEIRESAARQPNFADIWIDQRAGGVIKVAFVGGPTDRADIERKAADSPIEFVDATYTRAELESVREAVRAARLDLKAQGIWVREIGIDPRTNRVEVGLDEFNEAAAAELQKLFGDGILVEQSGNPTVTACTDRYHCIGPPVRAGIALSSGCSLAFLVKKSGVTGTGWLSAGHCASGTGAVWAHNGTNIGTIRANCWPNCLYSDALRGGELNSTYASYRVYRNPTSNTPVKAVQGFNGDSIGMQTCLNGRRQPNDTGWRCGVLDEINDVDYGGVFFLEQRYATYNAYNGDSGGAVHSIYSATGVTAYGVQSGCEDFGGVAGCEPGEVSGRGIYSHIYRVRTELGVTICSSSNPCP